MRREAVALRPVERDRTDARAGTITLHLTEPDSDLLLTTVTYPFGYVTPADHPFGSGAVPPGTGPYRIASFDPKRGARLVRNRLFRAWSRDGRDAGFADEIEIRVGNGLGRQVAAVRRHAVGRTWRW